MVTPPTAALISRATCSTRSACATAQALSALYEEESESEGEEKGLAIDDISKKKPAKMVATRWEQGRREGRTKNDEDVDDVENETISPELEVSKVSGRGRQEKRTNDDEDVDDVENKTSSPEIEVSKSEGKFGPMQMTKTTSMTSMMTVSVADHESMRRRGRGMTTMTVNRVDH